MNNLLVLYKKSFNTKLKFSVIIIKLFDLIAQKQGLRILN